MATARMLARVWQLPNCQFWQALLSALFARAFAIQVKCLINGCCQLNRSMQHFLMARSNSTSPREPICRAALNQNLARAVFRLTQHL
jgi:hypothetical protein